MIMIRGYKKEQTKNRITINQLPVAMHMTDFCQHEDNAKLTMKNQEDVNG